MVEPVGIRAYSSAEISAKQKQENAYAKLAIESPAFCAFLDIVGFRSLMARVDPQGLWEELHNIGFLAKSLEPEREGWNEAAKIAWGLQTRLVGDAVVIFRFPRFEGEVGVAEGVRAAANLAGVLMHRLWPVRCGMAYGTLLVSGDGKHFLGPALAEAKAIEEQQDWFGGAVGLSLASYLERYPVELNGLLCEGYLHPYPVPMKADSSVQVSKYAVGWPRGLPDSVDFSKGWDRVSGSPRPANYDTRKARSMEFLNKYRTARRKGRT